MTGRRLPPGPNAPPVVQALRLSRDPLRTLVAARERYGDVFTLRLSRVGTMVVVATPDALDTLLQGDPQIARAGTARRGLLPILPAGSALGADGPSHRAARDRLLGVLAQSHLQASSAGMAHVARQHVSGWPLGRPFALLPRVRALALDVFVRAVLAVRDPRRAAALHRGVLQMMWSPVVAPGVWVHDPRGSAIARVGWSLFTVLRRRLERLLRQELQHRRGQRETAGCDVLTTLAGADREVAEDVLVDELVGLLIAAVEPGGVGLTWMLERLGRHPAVVERILAERDGNDAVTRAAILETLHTRPAVIDAARELTTSVEVGGHDLPPGTRLIVAIPLLHDVLGSPDTQPFRPERWLTGDSPCPSVPFGGGERTCLGAALTIVQARAVVPAILAHVLLAPAGDPERVALRGTALVPHRGARMIATRRTGA